MKKILLITAIVLTIISCRKKKENEPAPEPQIQPKPYVNPYPRPWTTGFITFQNVLPPQCGDSHSQGYRLFYKDTMLRSTCGLKESFRHLSNRLELNDSTMLLYKFGELAGEVMYTRDGGYTWLEKAVGTRFFSKYQVVNPGLVYCVTFAPSLYYLVTGIDKSDLSISQVPNKKGRQV
jgi:hypothetical protein